MKTTETPKTKKQRKAPSEQGLPVLPSTFRVVNMRDAAGTGDYAVTLQDLAGFMERDYETLRVAVRRLGIQRYLDPEDRRRVVIDWNDILTLNNIKTRGKHKRKVVLQHHGGPLDGQLTTIEVPMPVTPRKPRRKLST